MRVGVLLPFRHRLRSMAISRSVRRKIPAQTRLNCGYLRAVGLAAGFRPLGGRRRLVPHELERFDRADIVRKSNGSLRVRSASTTGIPGASPGVPPSTNERGLKIKFGIAYDRTPTTNSDRSARVPTMTASG